MQAEDPPLDGTTSTRHDDEISSLPGKRTNAPPEIDPLVVSVVTNIADALNDLKRHRCGLSVVAHGSLDLSVGPQHYRLTLVQSEQGPEYPLTVKATRQTLASSTNHAFMANTSAHASMPRDSDAELEKDIVSRKRRQLQEEQGTDAHKRQRIERNAHGARDQEDDDEDEDNELFLSKRDLQGIVDKLREDIQDDTSECVNHVQKLLRRFKAEWHEHVRNRHVPAPSPLRSAVAGACPTPGQDGTNNTNMTETIKRESKLLSNQIKWVEECRRVAHEIHERREENWRTTSAGFHDRARQDREMFQHKMLHETNSNAQKLDQILSEVRAIGLYAQSMKWETPVSASLSRPQHPSSQTLSNFPTHVTPVSAPTASTMAESTQTSPNSQLPAGFRGQ